MTAGRGRATGKVILAGEHFVVYGAPAIAVPLPAVALEVEIRGPGGGPAPGGHVAACARIMHERWGGPDPAGLSIAVRSEIPVAAGLGSSAALSVALARAWAGLVGRAAGEGELREGSLACERLAHGAPSGIDTEVAVTGRAVRFVRGEAPRPQAVAAGIGLVVIDTGMPASTREMVEAVARGRAEAPVRFERLLAEASERADEVADALAAGDVARLGGALDGAQPLLAAVGVSTPEIERAVAAARAAGAAGAKLTGKGGGGTVIAACRESDAAALAERLRGAGWAVVAAGRIAPAA
ncbi:MAG: mevalonate kinase [Deltaproteobacteria bacterium]|nr:mevalonate kinase [Deltaproteobacteria bacterium]